MNTTEIIVIVLATALVVATISGSILRRVIAKKKGKKITSCGCSCANCPNASCQNNSQCKCDTSIANKKSVEKS